MPMIHSQEDRDLALQVWAFYADRNATRTAAMLAEEHGVVIPARTLRQWAQDNTWLDRAQELYRQQAPDLFDQTRFTLVAAGPHSSRYLFDCVRLLPDGSYAVAKPDRARVAAAFGNLDRIGFLPVTKAEAAAHHPTNAPMLPAGSDETSIAGMSDADLLRLAHGHLAAPTDTDAE